MRRFFLISAAVLLLTVPGLAAEAPDQAALTTLLNQFLDGASRNDPAMHDRFWAEDLIYTGSAGRRVGKADIMKDVRSAPASKPGEPATRFTAEEVRIQQYGDMAVVAFRLVGTTDEAGKATVMKFLNTGTFLKRNGTWQAVAWQATKTPEPESAK